MKSRNKLILLQNLFCINRSHWFERKTYKVLGNLVFYTTVITLISINIFYFTDTNKVKILPHSSLLFAYSFKYILIIELAPLAFLSKRDVMNKKLELLEEICSSEPNFIRKAQISENDNSAYIILLSVISCAVDLIGLYLLDYPLSVVATLPLAFAAHDTEILLYSLIIKEFNATIKSLMEVNASAGTKVYRHILITTSHFSEDYSFTINLIVLMTLTTTVLYIGTAIVIEGPRTQKVLSYLVYRELRSLYSLWILCSASFNTSVLSKSLVKRLTERLVFRLDTEDELSREMTKRWLRCAKSLQVRYFPNSAFTLTLALPLAVVDYTTNYFLIIVQGYPLIK